MTEGKQDIVERLRMAADAAFFGKRNVICDEAADTITSLLEALEALVALDSDGAAGCWVDEIQYGETLDAARKAIALTKGKGQ
jgi:hypothetical protein